MGGNNIEWPDYKGTSYWLDTTVHYSTHTKSLLYKTFQNSLPLSTSSENVASSFHATDGQMGMTPLL